MEHTQVGRSDPRAVRGFRRFARVVAVLAIAVASMVLMGWAGDIAALKAMLPGHVDMKANTALCMLAMGSALLGCRSPSASRRGVSAALALAAMVLGALTLVQYAWRVDLGIDMMFFDDPALAMNGRIPGRMSQVSALSFVLLGGAGIANCLARWAVAAQGLLLAVIAIALYALSTFGYFGPDLQERIPFSPIALHTALLLLTLALGMLAVRPEAGLMRVLSADSFGGAVSRRALLPSLLVPSLLSYAAQGLQARGMLSPDATITLLALASGGLLAWIIWSVSALLDRVEREQRVTSDMREDALTDELTQLGNRRAFQTAIAELLRRRRDEAAVFSLLILDLDRFKTFNDTHGHVAGDQALRQVGRLLKAALRPGDVAGRYGGEEFAVLLPGLEGERALLVAERIRRDFQTMHWPHQPLTVSIGVAQARAEDEELSLVARADRALYAAKAGGRDRAVIDTALPSLDEPVPLQPNLL